MSSIFTYTPAEYQARRQFNFVDTYVRDMALGLSKLRGIPVSDAETFIRKGIEDGTINYVDPKVKALKREENTDKHKYMTTLTGYLEEVKKNRHIMSPTFTSYLHPNVKTSELSIFTEYNVKQRGLKKKSSFQKKMAGDLDGAAMDWSAQGNAKENNNSTSGAFNSEHNPIYNRSAHSTLTSVCRTCAAMANTNTERFTVGKRHLMDAEMTICNILSVLNNMDLTVCEQVIEKYQLHYVSHEELMAALKMSTDLYWHAEEPMRQLDNFVRTLNPLERTIYLYTGDFYHVRVFNDQFVRDIFEPIVNPPRILDDLDVKAILKDVDEDVFVLYALVFGKIPKTQNKEKDRRMAEAIVGLEMTLNKYKDFIQCFWRNDCLPPETGQMPSMVRTAVLGGDTDSTLFTVMSWCEWFIGELNDSPESVNVAAATIFFSSMMVKHYLAIVSGVMGVPQKRIHQMAMKNEFYFPIFVLTRRSKHYMSLILAQEGNYLPEMDEEKKGVGLLNRKAPTFILEEADKFITELMTQVWETRQVEVEPILKRIAILEYQLYQSIMHGDVEFFKRESIKDASVYAKPMSSVYASYDMWENVFAPKYGHIPSLPMLGVRITLEINTRTQLVEWLATFEDVELRKRMERWLTKTGKTNFKTVTLPLDIVASRGIPYELRRAINFRKIIFEIMETFYIVLESLGIYMINSNNTLLCLDEYPELFESREDHRAFKDNNLLTDSLTDD